MLPRCPRPSSSFLAALVLLSLCCLLSALGTHADLVVGSASGSDSPTTTAAASAAAPTAPAPTSAEANATTPDAAQPTKQFKNTKPVQLVRDDFCKACYSVVEEFHRWTVKNFADPSARRNSSMTRNELVEWFCRNGVWENWKEGLVWGCIKTVQDHHDAILHPFLGVHTSAEYTTLGAVFEHRVKACALPSVNACDAWVPEGRARTDCEACDRLVGDLSWALSREVVVNATVVKRILSTVCMEVGMRHDKPMEIETFCHEHVDEHWFDLQKMLVKLYNDPAVTAAERPRMLKKKFCGAMTEVCEAERAEMAAEIKDKKAKERAARLAARAEAAKGGRKKPVDKDEL